MHLKAWSSRISSAHHITNSRTTTYSICIMQSCEQKIPVMSKSITSTHLSLSQHNKVKTLAISNEYHQPTNLTKEQKNDSLKDASTKSQIDFLANKLSFIKSCLLEKINHLKRKN